ncbi:hypothetical protein GT348_00340 [Aristophania vespae]|uniref:Uncharacterized protein n=1 Tax=Aristophania vespae TaxID=2697033 RepID=A0A6P1NDF5_9PROT|nr:hypothetical protein [Aristophania vespae]QHI94977.1 hypothetical protein GT348_00340 [Aristophania vespae]UMM64144.1 hypothetical protein DM15PD_11350 [Aristophania vespae]
MSFAAIDASRVEKAAGASLQTLRSAPEPTEAYQRKVLMIERIEALARAAAETKGQGVITLTSEEFWLISRNW